MSQQKARNTYLEPDLKAFMGRRVACGHYPGTIRVAIAELRLVEEDERNREARSWVVKVDSRMPKQVLPRGR